MRTSFHCGATDDMFTIHFQLFYASATFWCMCSVRNSYSGHGVLILGLGWPQSFQNDPVRKQLLGILSWRLKHSVLWNCNMQPDMAAPVVCVFSHVHNGHWFCHYCWNPLCSRQLVIKCWTERNRKEWIEHIKEVTDNEGEWSCLIILYKLKATKRLPSLSAHEVGLNETVSTECSYDHHFLSSHLLPKISIQICILFSF
jgi:hypothetical protein